MLIKELRGTLLQICRGGFWYVDSFQNDGIHFFWKNWKKMLQMSEPL